MATNNIRNTYNLFPLADAKRPPAWDQAWESVYSFRMWRFDVITWSAGTDVVETRQGHLLILSLSGLAKEIAQDILYDQVTHGADIYHRDGNGPVHTPGLHAVL